MNNEEKIRLVLETLGVDSVRQANKELRDLSKSLDETGKAAGSATGQKGGSGQGILQLAFAIDDLQYGIRGIVNNIPQVVQALGLGAGFAGAAGIAAVAVNQLVARHPEWFEWSEKVRSKLVELNDVIKAEEAAIKRQKDAIDKLGESNSTRIEDILKLKSMTEDLQAAEDQLDKDRKNRKAAEDAAKNKGVAADEEFAFRKDITKQLFTDTGMEEELLKGITQAVEESTPAVDEAQLKAEVDAWIKTPVVQSALATMKPQDRRTAVDQYTGRERTRKNSERDKTVSDTANTIYGGIIKPKDQAELDDAMGNLSKLAPQIASTIKRYYDVEKRAEEAQKELDSSIEGIREATSKRKKDKAEAERELNSGMRFGPDRGVLNAAMQAQELGELGKNQQNAAIRESVMSGIDPVSLAAMRRAQAGTGRGAVQAMRQLESRDMEALSGMFMQNGMNRQDARKAAGENLLGGEEQFAEFAKSQGQSTKNLREGFAAAVEYMQILERERQEIMQVRANQMQMMNMMQGNNPPMRPQMNRARQ